MSEARIPVIEPCRRCETAVCVWYLMDDACPGYRVQPLGPCGNPARCGEKVHGREGVPHV
ncbi:MAG: hypothetical protein RID91_08985 [Azospirillaceae bacterium]